MRSNILEHQLVPGRCYSIVVVPFFVVGFVDDGFALGVGACELEPNE